MVQEQYFSVCRKEMAMHLKEGKPKTIQELGKKAENYVEAHATDIVFGIDPKPSNIRSLRPGLRQCHICDCVSMCCEIISPFAIFAVFDVQVYKLMFCTFIGLNMIKT